MGDVSFSAIYNLCFYDYIREFLRITIPVNGDGAGGGLHVECGQITLKSEKGLKTGYCQKQQQKHSTDL